jgi:hypothetical protein
MHGSRSRLVARIALGCAMLPSIPAWGLCPGPNDCFRGSNCNEYVGDGTVCTVDACSPGGQGLCGFVLGNPVRQCVPRPGTSGCAPRLCEVSACPLPPGCDRAGECIGQGTCEYSPAPPGQACSDSNACTSNDMCTGAAGVCAGSPIPGCQPCSTPSQCDDANPCTTDSCPNGACMHGSAVGVVCRQSAGPCDVAETCPAAAAVCPPDGFLPSSTVCRRSAGVCDVAETCTGTSAACPVDGLLPATAVCRAATGLCDVAESCTGTSAACPNNAFLPSSTVCREAAGVCDVAENCTGSGAACPADGFSPAMTVCRPAAGECDRPETCPGTEPTCPPDVAAPESTACGSPASSECDAADTCNDQHVCAPNHATAGTACTDDRNVCTSDVCDDTGACLHLPNAATCNDGNACTRSDTCSGGACVGSDAVSCAPADQCREAGICNAETGACSSVPKADGTACDDGNGCTAPDTCQSGTCTGGPATSCDDGNACTADRCDSTAGCAHAPAADGTPCDDGQACTSDERCVGATCQGGTFSCGEVETKAPPPGPNPVIRVTCATTGDAGGSEKGSCEAVGFLDSGAEPASISRAAPDSVRNAHAVAAIEASGAAESLVGAADAQPVAALATPGAQVTRGPIRRRLNRRGRSTVKLRLNALGKRLLKEAGRLPVVVSVQVTDRTGRATSLQSLLTLLRRRL